MGEESLSADPDECEAKCKKTKDYFVNHVGLVGEESLSADPSKLTDTTVKYAKEAISLIRQKANDFAAKLAKL